MSDLNFARTMLLDAMANGADGAIERMETRQSNAAVQSGRLPRRMLSDEQAEALGFIPTGQENNLLKSYVFPDGWKTKNHPEDGRHKTLLDAKGRERGALSICIRGYDDFANGYLFTRYRVSKDRTGNYESYKNNPEFVLDCETGKNLYQSTFPAYPEQDETSAEQDCTSWLNQNFSNWRNPIEYWSNDNS